MRTRRLAALATLTTTALLVGCASGGDSDIDAGNAPTSPAAVSPSATSSPKPTVTRVPIPDVIGMGEDEARATLEAAGFVVETIGSGTQVSIQTPSSAVSAEAGTKILITMITPVPDGTRADPFAAGTPLKATLDDGSEVDITIGAATWDAWDVVHAENQFNDPAPEGSSWVLVPVTITNVSSTDAITPWLAFNVVYVAPDGRSFDPASAVLPGSLRDVGDLFEGGVGTGNLGFTIPADALGGLWAVSYGYSSSPVFVVAS